MKLALGPIQYFWPVDEVYDFYVQAMEWPVDIVYLGETVCAKRRQLRLEDWLTLAKGLKAVGKEVVLSTLVLLEAESELARLKRICGNDHYPVEANDMAAVRQLAGEIPFVAGPHINCYNGETLAMLAELGAYRWVPPVEISQHTLADLLATRPTGLQTEVFAYGRLPLAFSARCFTARAADLPKDQCDFRCGDDPDGLLLKTQEDQALFTLNGIQIQSAVPCNLLGDIDQLQKLAVDVLRISPQSQGTGQIIESFHAVLNGEETAASALAALEKAKSDNSWCNGYWHGEPGMNYINV